MKKALRGSGVNRCGDEGGEVKQGMRAEQENQAGTRFWQQEVGSSDEQGA